jgi:glycosyltransferase involved in cell wall biosynthesis
MNTISIIIPTYNGRDKIGRLIKALQCQTYLDFEVIVVIDGSLDNTRQVIESITTPFKKVIVEKENGGRAAARNSGVKHATGDLLVFYDDDMEPYENSVADHIKFHRRYEGIVTGNQRDLSSKERTDIQKYRASVSQSWTSGYKDDLNRLTYSNLFFSTANSSFKKSDIQKLKGFDESLTDAEDYEIAWRALKAGINVYFDKSNLSIHHDLITCKSYIKRQREYRLAHTKLYELHPDIPQSKIDYSFLKKAFYLLFSFSVLPHLIDSFNIFLLLPKKIRYKFYDITIQSLARVYPNVKL